MVTLPTLFIATLAFAQAPLGPVVHADKSVTFRLAMPNAKRVDLSVEGMKTVSMQRSDAGVWEYTSGSLRPDIYGYSFSVDGTTVLDPNNSERKPNLIWPSNALLVPGDKPEPWEIQPVSHGTLHHHFYKSKVIGDERDYFVYTPAGYSSQSAKLPVLYLLHGYSDTAVGWTEVGKAHVIMDNLIAEKKIKPMIVVMTLGYGVSDFGKPGGRAFGDINLLRKNYSQYSDALLQEVIPAIEKDYRVIAKRESRAIAGLSMGGAESLYVGLNHLDTFGYIGAFSAAGLPSQDPMESLKGFTPEKGKKLKVMWMACGTEDGLIGFQRGFSKWLKNQGVDVKTKETPGGHIWPLWRRYLVEYSGMLFK